MTMRSTRLRDSWKMRKLVSTNNPITSSNFAASGFSGSAYGEVVDAPNPTNFTLAAVVKLSSVASSAIVTRTSGGGGYGGAWSHQMLTVGSNWGVYVFPVGTDTGPAASTNWALVLALCDQGTGLESFVDNVTNGMTSSATAFWTGGDRWGIGPPSGGASAFNGAIAWCGLWNSVLNSTDRTALFTGGPSAVVSLPRWLIDYRSGAPVFSTTAGLSYASVGGALTYVPGPP